MRRVTFTMVNNFKCKISANFAQIIFSTKISSNFSGSKTTIKLRRQTSRSFDIAILCFEKQLWGYDYELKLY